MTQYETKDSGAREKFASGMQRDTEAGKPRFDLLIPEGVPFEDQLLTRFALLMGRGAEKYEDRNWEQADSEAEIARAKSSAFRHFMQWFCGERDEDHAAAVMFNLLVVETTEPKVGRDDSSYYAEVADKLLGNHREPWQPGTEVSGEVEGYDPVSTLAPEDREAEQEARDAEADDAPKDELPPARGVLSAGAARTVEQAGESGKGIVFVQHIQGDVNQRTTADLIHDSMNRIRREDLRF